MSVRCWKILKVMKIRNIAYCTLISPISNQDLVNFQAVARHSCMELLNVYEEDLKSACINNEDLVMKSKIRRLDKINKLLAHRPWAIKGNHIKVHISQVNHFQIVFFVHHFTGYSFWDRLRNFLHIFTWIVLSVHKLNKLGKFW